MVSNQLADFSIQAHLAHIVGARFTYVTGPSLVDAEISTNHRDHFHADFRIPLLRYRGALRQAVRGLE
jgi:galactose-1-phosphate uridylyltransferase